MINIPGAERPLSPEADLQPKGAAPAILDRRSAERKRLSIEISADLHRRILAICATRRVPVNQAVRAVLERAFPAA